MAGNIGSHKKKWQCCKGVTGKEWPKTLTRQKAACAKAEASRNGADEAVSEHEKAHVALIKAASKAARLEKRSELDWKRAIDLLY